MISYQILTLILVVPVFSWGGTLPMLSPRTFCERQLLLPFGVPNEFMFQLTSEFLPFFFSVAPLLWSQPPTTKSHFSVPWGLGVEKDHLAKSFLLGGGSNQTKILCALHSTCPGPARGSWAHVREFLRCGSLTSQKLLQQPAHQR